MEIHGPMCPRTLRSVPPHLLCPDWLLLLPQQTDFLARPHMGHPTQSDKRLERKRNKLRAVVRDD